MIDPAPVWNAQANGAAISKGILENFPSREIQFFSWVNEKVEKDDCWK